MSAPHSRQTSPPETPERPGLRVELGVDERLRLECGVELGPFTMAYQTYGALDGDKSNAILVCHALSGDQFLAGEHPVTGKKGWWDVMAPTFWAAVWGRSGRRRPIPPRASPMVSSSRSSPSATW